MIKYYKDGRAIYESAETDIKDKARELLRKREGKIFDGAPVPTAKTRRLQFEAAVADVVNDYTANERSSIGNLTARIDNYPTPFFSGRRMTTITTADVRAYITARLTAKASAATVNRELSVLKRAFRMLLRYKEKGERLWES